MRILPLDGDQVFLGMEMSKTSAFVVEGDKVSKRSHDRLQSHRISFGITRFEKKVSVLPRGKNGRFRSYGKGISRSFYLQTFAPGE
jgi:hypothetical protein